MNDLKTEYDRYMEQWANDKYKTILGWVEIGVGKLEWVNIVIFLGYLGWVKTGTFLRAWSE